MIELTECVEEFGGGGRNLTPVAPLLLDPIAVIAVQPHRQGSRLLAGTKVLVDTGREFLVQEDFRTVRSMIEGVDSFANSFIENPGYFSSEDGFRA